MSTQKRFDSRGCTRYTSKRGQITVFMIIGIVIVFLFAGIFYVTQNKVKEDFTADGDPIIKAVPTAFQPIQTYTEACLTRVGERALRILGGQGGYIYPDLVGKYSSTDPSDSDGIALSGAQVPFWLYNVEKNSVNKIAFTSLRPEIHSENDPANSIESQIGRYVDETLESCLQNYEVFNQQGFLVSHEVPKTTVTITDQTVNLLLAMTVTASNQNTDSEFTKTLVKIPLQLKRYYQAAEEITKLQKNVSFLEQQALELVQIFSAKDSGKLPPTYAIGHEIIPSVSWNVIDVKKNIKNLLSSYVSMVRFVQTDDFVTYQYPLSDLQGLYQRTYDNSALPLEQAQGLDINFDYLAWEPYVKVGEKNGVIEPQHVAVHNFGIHQGIQNYRTVYDISYPVLVTVRDDAALNGEGYNFVFALESNVRKNRPAEDGEELLPARTSTGTSMVCDENKFNTKPLRTIVVDSYTKEPLDFVNIGFKVPNSGTCEMGQTDGKGTILTKYPAVYGGIINFVKEDYLSNQYAIDTYKFQEQGAIVGYATGLNPPVVVPLHKKATVDIIATKKNLDKCIDAKCFFSGPFGAGGSEIYSYQIQGSDKVHKWFLTGVSKKLGQFEEVLISLKRIRDLYEGSNNEVFNTVVRIEYGIPQPTDLYPGVYEVSATITKNEPVLFPEDTRCDGACVTVEEQVLTSMVIGQITWDDEDSYLVITPEQLYGAQTIEFRIPSMNIDAVPEESGVRVPEDQKLIGNLVEISKEHKKTLEPLYK